MYPIPKADILVHAPVNWGQAVSPNGAGWGELWQHSLVLWSMGIAAFVLAMMKFRKRLT